jgi:hypothetical protein
MAKPKAPAWFPADGPALMECAKRWNPSLSGWCHFRDRIIARNIQGDPVQLFHANLRLELAAETATRRAKSIPASGRRGRLR